MVNSIRKIRDIDTTLSDAEVQTIIATEDAYVKNTGDTMTGDLTITENTTGTYNLLSSFYVPDLNNNQYVEFIIGKEEDYYNRGTINFQYLSSGNTSNALNFGFYGVASAFKVQGNGDCTSLRDLIATRKIISVGGTMTGDLDFSVSTGINSAKYVKLSDFNQTTGGLGTMCYQSEGYNTTFCIIGNPSLNNQVNLNTVNVGASPLTFTFPSASGTFAMTSDLSSYLALAGGTMTGTINSRAIIPTADKTYDLGSTTYGFKDLHLENSLIMKPSGNQSARAMIDVSADFSTTIAANLMNFDGSLDVSASGTAVIRGMNMTFADNVASKTGGFNNMEALKIQSTGAQVTGGTAGRNNKLFDGNYPSRLFTGGSGSSDNTGLLVSQGGLYNLGGTHTLTATGIKLTGWASNAFGMTSQAINSNGGDWEIAGAGDLLFTGSGGGLTYGEIYEIDNTTATTISTQNTWYQITIFGNNGVSNNTTPDHTNDHITVGTTGVYRVDYSASFSGTGGKTYELEVKKNNGATSFTNTRVQRKLGTTGDVGNAGGTGLLSLTANDTVELWIRCIDVVTGNATMSEGNLNLIKIGG